MSDTIHTFLMFFQLIWQITKLFFADLISGDLLKSTAQGSNSNGSSVSQVRYLQYPIVVNPITVTLAEAFLLAMT